MAQSDEEKSDSTKQAAPLELDSVLNAAVVRVTSLLAWKRDKEQWEKRGLDLSIRQKCLQREIEAWAAEHADLEARRVTSMAAGAAAREDLAIIDSVLGAKGGSRLKN